MFYKQKYILEQFTRNTHSSETAATAISTPDTTQQTFKCGKHHKTGFLNFI